MDGCVFCAIVAGDAPAEVVHRDDVAVAFLDRTPLFAGHVLVVPTVHVVTLPELVEVGPFFERVRLLATAVPQAMGAQGTFVANNNIVSQSVAHLHVHVVPRWRGDSNFMTTVANTRTLPEAIGDSAAKLRAAWDPNRE